jgi:phosphoribosylamine--glycine ligase
MKVLIIGGGGREHAIAWKVAQNSRVEKIYCAPGNGGTAIEEKCENVAITKIDELVAFAKNNSIELTIVGPEAPLTEGVVDAFKAADLKIFGPSSHGAKLEGSKIFSKDFMKKYEVKTAQYAAFDDIEKAKVYLKSCIYPTVIKADGLAAGKGVVICATEEEALKTLEEFMIDDIFKGAGKNIVIEEFLEGVEASILSITDGETIIPFLSAKDHKQIFDENKGPNTGGMGVIAPNPYVTEEVLAAFKKDIMIPTVEGIKAEKMDFTGIVFFGIMINKRGVYCLEYNVRMGDPETEAVLPLMESDFLELIEAALNGDLSKASVKWSKGSACCVVAASGGYPGAFEKGYKISLEEMDSKVFMAGAKAVDGKVVTDGGRVLCVTAVDETLEKAIKKAYEDIKKVSFEKIYYRKDIGTLYQ